MSETPLYRKVAEMDAIASELERVKAELEV